MGLLSESLTVRILGDSSGLQRELSAVARQIEEFRRRMSQVTELSQRVGRMSGLPSEMQGGLEGVTAELSGIRELIGQINSTPLVIDVTPALAGLQMVASVLEAIAARMQMLAAGPGIPGPQPGGVPATVNTGRRMAGGGLVSGESGIDRVPTWLTAGEFVLQRPVVEQMGVNALHRMNQGEWPGQRVPQRGPALSAGTTSQVVNDVGGITVNLHERMDLLVRLGARLAP